MGRIKQKFIKKAAVELYEAMPDKVGVDFEKNKVTLKELNITESKKVRNKIAGYIKRTARLETGE